MIDEKEEEFDDPAILDFGAAEFHTASPVIEQPEKKMEAFGRVVGVDDPKRNWYEDAIYENGNYQNTCVSCRKYFIGHKRRVLCKLCAPVEPVTEQESSHWYEAKVSGHTIHLELYPSKPQEFIGLIYKGDNCVATIQRESFQEAMGKIMLVLESEVSELRRENTRLKSDLLFRDVTMLPDKDREIEELRRELESGCTEKRTLFEGSINPMIPPQEVEHIKDPAKYIVYLLKKVEELERQLEFYQDKNQNQ